LKILEIIKLEKAVSIEKNLIKYFNSMHINENMLEKKGSLEEFLEIYYSL
jgi:hypothetical protein